MKAILEFNFPEEINEHSMAVNGARFLQIIDDLQQHLKQLKKYSDFNAEQMAVVEDIRGYLSVLLYGK